MIFELIWIALIRYAVEGLIFWNWQWELWFWNEVHFLFDLIQYGL